MDIFQFELRYLSYEWLFAKMGITVQPLEIVEATKITNAWQLTQALDKTTPDELKELTLQTYTLFKTSLIENHRTEMRGEYTVAEYMERLEYELKVVHEMWFNTYLLIVQDFINRAKRNHICVGPGRWSGAGSLVARCTGITDVNPLEFWLLFERFLNPARVSMPDIDVDFEDQSRDQVLQYVSDKYGAENISKIGTFMKMASKAAFKDVARVLGVPFEQSNLISNVIPPKVSLIDLLNDSKCDTSEYPDISKLIQGEPRIQKAFEIASILENNMRQLWVHACGIVIAPSVVTDYTPVQSEQHSRGGMSSTVTQREYKYLEGKMWLIKMDFLWLINLTVIKNCIKILKAKAQKNWHVLSDIFKSFEHTSVFEPPLWDSQVYEKVFQQWDTSGIFQFEWEGIRRFLIQLKPTDINDIVAMAALYRPWPMEFIPVYIARKHGTEEINYMHPELYQMITNQYGEDEALAQKELLIEDLWPIMDVSYGIAVYQEQLMVLVQRMAWFALAEADNLRRGIGKKIKEVIEKIKIEFVEKAATFRWYKSEVSTYIYEKMIEPAASYSFNKSHSVAYALIAYQTAYLKTYYPVEFYASLLRSREEDTDRLSLLIDEVLSHGIPVLPPDINDSYHHVAAIDDSVRLGFLCIKGIGSDVAESLEQERKNNGLFVSLEDVLKRCQPFVQKKMLESLIKAGALDRFAERALMFEHLDYLVNRSKTSSSQWDGGLFGDMSSMVMIQFARHVPPATNMQKLLMEYDVLKTFVSGHPFDGCYPYLKKDMFISAFKTIENAGNVIINVMIKNITRAKKKGFFIQIEDITDSIEFFIKEPLDFKKFDILTIEWYKGRSFKVSKIIKRSIEELVTDATKRNKYDPALSVAKVKQLRLLPKEESQVEKKADIPDAMSETVVVNSWLTTWSESNKQKEIEHFALSEDALPDPFPSSISELPESSEILISPPSESFESSENPESSIVPKALSLPNDPHKLKLFVSIIKSHPGSLAVSIWSKVVYLSQAGVEMLERM